MPNLFILRGIPGSGKSTYAKSQPGAVICSADDFFVQPDGSYAYDKSKIQLAHDFCFKKCHDALHAGEQTVIIDNMNTTAWEISPYVMLGRNFGYRVEILNFPCDQQVGVSRNVHHVPLKDIEKTAKLIKTTKLPKSWLQSDAC
ncbi:MAG: ATP-binding protein [Patescibacteria group bacterium]|jgi:predicted kinase